jgi:hypothetical protein
VRSAAETVILLVDYLVKQEILWEIKTSLLKGILIAKISCAEKLDEESLWTA